MLARAQPAEELGPRGDADEDLRALIVEPPDVRRHHRVLAPRERSADAGDDAHREGTLPVPPLDSSGVGEEEKRLRILWFMLHSGYLRFFAGAVRSGEKVIGFI